MRIPVALSLAAHAAALSAAAAIGVASVGRRAAAAPDWTVAIAPEAPDVPAGAEERSPNALPLVAEIRPESWTPPAIPSPDAPVPEPPRPSDPAGAEPLDEPGEGPAAVAWTSPSAPAAPAGSEHAPVGDGAANPAPRYPEAARRRGVEGTVSIRVMLAPDGRVSRAEVARSSGSALLDEAAREALANWRFPPPASDAPVEIAIRFVLQDGEAGGVRP